MRRLSPSSAADLLASLRRSTSDDVLRLAYHAALPVVIDAGLLNLVRVNFFQDPPEVLPFEAEADLLLSPLFREIGDDLYEMDPAVRNILLAGLQTRYGKDRVQQVALLLELYTECTPAWNAQPELEQAQRLTALSFVDPVRADTWLDEARSGGKAETLQQEWFVAMRQRLATQSADATTASELAAAVRRLSDPDPDVRMSAVRLLGALAQLPDAETEPIVIALAELVRIETTTVNGHVAPEVQAALALIDVLPHSDVLAGTQRNVDVTTGYKAAEFESNAVDPDPAAAGLTLLVEASQRAVEELGSAVPPDHMRALLIIGESGGLSLSQLAEAMGASGSATSRLCDRMQAAGLLRRDRVAANRPEIVLVPTESGRRLAAWVRGRRRAALGEVLAAMTPEGREALARGLTALVDPDHRSFSNSVYSAGSRGA